MKSTLSDYREFDGEKYFLKNSGLHKIEAERQAEVWRHSTRGGFARIVKYMDYMGRRMHAIYVRGP